MFYERPAGVGQGYTGDGVPDKGSGDMSRIARRAADTAVGNPSSAMMEPSGRARPVMYAYINVGVHVGGKWARKDVKLSLIHI